MKITIDTEVDTFDAALAAVQVAYGQSGASGSGPSGSDEDDDGYLPGNWTRPRLRKLVEWLSDSDAAIALRFIAENAPAVGIETVFEHMAEQTGHENFDGKAMGGACQPSVSLGITSAVGSRLSMRPTTRPGSIGWTRTSPRPFSRRWTPPRGREYPRHAVGGGLLTGPTSNAAGRQRMARRSSRGVVRGR